MNLEIHYAEDWAALYVDGKLEYVGDSYLTEERAFALLGVITSQDDAFMRGQNKREGVAQTLAEVAEYSRKRAEKYIKAERLRAQASKLIAEADELV